VTLFEQRLTDPDAKGVLGAIERAFGAVNPYGATSQIAATKVSMRRLAARTADEPEGVEFWASSQYVGLGNVAGQVLVAWWTAASGRRHVRVTGRVVDHHRSYLVNAMKMTTRPPAWHVFPDRVYRRRVGPANDLVAVCGCGACGTAWSLGWAGPSCGPCFDYTQDHGTEPPARPALLPTPAPCRAVAVAANGRWVAGAAANQVFVWDLDAGPGHVRQFAQPGDTDLAPRLALSPDGSLLAVAGVGYHGLRVFDLTPAVARVTGDVYGASAVAFDPTGADILYADTGRLVLADAPDLAARTPFLDNVNPAGPIAFAPDGDRVAVRVGDQLQVHAPGAERLPVAFQLPASIRFTHNPQGVVPGNADAHAAFSPDGGQIAAAVGQGLSVHHAATGERRFWDGKLPSAVTGLAYDPAGKWLYAGREDGSLLAYRTDLFDAARTVTFRWSLGPLRGLAASGDGETLFTAGDEGVKAWPIRRLLEGV
jgi:WD domain, G-beta repeat